MDGMIVKAVMVCPEGLPKEREHSKAFTSEDTMYGLGS